MSLSLTHFSTLNIDKTRIASQFSKCADQYHASALIQQAIGNALIARIQNSHVTDGVSLRSEQRVLDIGCGTGYLQQCRPPLGLYSGVDIAKGMINKAKALTEGKSNAHCYDFTVGDAEALPYCSSSFDQAFSSMALQWLASPWAVSHELNRVLTPDGQAFLAILTALPELQAGWKSVNQDARINRFLAATQWSEAFAFSGFRIESYEKQDFVSVHSDIFALLHSIKGIGAGTVQNHVLPPLNRQTLSQLSSWWQVNHSRSERLALTYQVGFWHLKRAN